MVLLKRIYCGGLGSNPPEAGDITRKSSFLRGRVNHLRTEKGNPYMADTKLRLETYMNRDKGNPIEGK